MGSLLPIFLESFSMDSKLDKALCEKYPKIFCNRHSSPQETLMCFGFECGDGWYTILNNLCRAIQRRVDSSRRSRCAALKYNRALKRAISLNDASPLVKYFCGDKPVSDWDIKSAKEQLRKETYRVVNDACPQVVAVQVKEKFGGLRFYYQGGDDYVYGLVTFAEMMSESTCEVCGDAGKSRGGPWVVTACDKHAKDKGTHQI